MSHNIHSAKVVAMARAFVACAGSGKEGEPWADMEVEGLRHLRNALDALDAQGSPAIASDPNGAAKAAALAVRAALNAEAAAIGEMSSATYPLAEGLVQSLLAVAYELRAARLEAEARARDLSGAELRELRGRP